MGRVGIAIMLAAVVSGCGTSNTETGYEPRRLGMGDAQRRGLYAPKYSIEQAKAQAEAEGANRRQSPSGAPGAYGPGQ